MSGLTAFLNGGFSPETFRENRRETALQNAETLRRMARCSLIGCAALWLLSCFLPALAGGRPAYTCLAAIVWAADAAARERPGDPRWQTGLLYLCVGANLLAAIWLEAYLYPGVRPAASVCLVLILPGRILDRPFRPCALSLAAVLGYCLCAALTNPRGLWPEAAILWAGMLIGWLLGYVNVQRGMRFILLQRELAAGEARANTQRRDHQAQAEENRLAIMLSQIQPHFIYNALNTIQYYCQTDPGTAADAIEHFSRFLRVNMDSLSQKEPIPFDRELEHLNNYLRIEQLRFDDIRVEYDIGVTSFRIPVLTLQPLVENAIRYGLRPKKGGGTVRILTQALADGVRIRISDDGVGFDPFAQQADGRSHIGISNTRNRLETMVQGSLSVDSVPGEGTRVTILLPRREEGGV